MDELTTRESYATNESGLLIKITEPPANRFLHAPMIAQGWGWWWDDGDGWDGWWDADGWDGDGWDGWDGDY